LSRASYWELHWEREAAIVEAARRLARNRDDPSEIARIISSMESKEGWLSLLLVKLGMDEARVRELIMDLNSGLKPREELVELVLRAVKSRG